MGSVIAILGACIGGCSAVQPAPSSSLGSVTVPVDYLTSMVLPVSSADILVVLDGGTEGLSFTDARGEKRHIYIDRGGGPGWREVTTHGRRWSEIVVGDINRGRALDYDGEEGVFLLDLLRDLRSRGVLTKYDGSVFEKEILNRRKAAQPGATDNPDGAQRLREDH